MSVGSTNGVRDAVLLGTWSRVPGSWLAKHTALGLLTWAQASLLSIPERMLLPAGIQSLLSVELSPGCPRSPSHPETQLIPCFSQQLRELGLNQASL